MGMSTLDIIKSATAGFIGGAMGEAYVQIKQHKTVDPSKVLRAAVVGAIIAPAHRMASNGLRSAFGLPNYTLLPKGDDSDDNWAAATD
jgi:hypothetical protein